jgi:hypothetical protein
MTQTNKAISVLLKLSTERPNKTAERACRLSAGRKVISIRKKQPHIKQFLSFTKNTAILSMVFSFFSNEPRAEHINPYEKISHTLNGDILKYSLNKRGDCAIFQVLDTKTLNIKSTKRMCSFRGASFWDQVADAHFYNISFSGTGIKFHLSITPLYPVKEEIFECIAPIKASKLLPIICTPLPEQSLKR